jgi:hypothetical protein
MSYEILPHGSGAGNPCRRRPYHVHLYRLGLLTQYAHVWALPLYLVFPMWAFWMGLAMPIVNRRYR